MVSIKIIDSAKFIKMPVSSRALYYDLIIRADDDGIVEAFNVMRMTGATEDDLKVLVSKGFVIVLNEDLVSYIADWNEHNLIRPDRKIDSIYKDLLVKMVGDVKLIEARPRANFKNKNIENGQPMDNQWTDNGQHRLGKVRLGKDSIGKVSLVDSGSEEPTPPPKELKEVKHKYGEYNHVLLTDKEYESLIADFEEPIIKDYIKKIDEYLEQYGKKGYKNYNLTIRNWIRRDKTNNTTNNSKTPYTKPSSFTEYNQREVDFAEIEKQAQSKIETETTEDWREKLKKTRETLDNKKLEGK